MLRAELVALETRAAEVALLGIDPVMVLCKNAHGAHVDADPALHAALRIKIDLETDRCWGTDFQKKSPALTEKSCRV
jgi:hypothetical protein